MEVKIEISSEKSQRAFLNQSLASLNWAENEWADLIGSSAREVHVEIPLRRRNGSIEIFHGFRVQHNDCRGPFKGGLRFHPSVDLAHCRPLAALVTLKTSLLNIPFGGAKGGIACDPSKLESIELEILTKKFTERMSPFIGPNRDVAAPDVGTGPREMAWIVDEFSKSHGFQPGVVTGKPINLGGSEGRLESTGIGVAVVTQWVCEAEGIDLKDSRVAIQGFGNVGSQLAKSLDQAGAKLVAISDKKGGIYNEEGLDIQGVISARAAMTSSTSISELSGKDAESITNQELLELPVDILIPAAMENSIGESTARRLKAKIVVEAANLPVNVEADRILQDRNIPVVPDILANSGGVCVSYFEWSQNRQGIHRNKHEILDNMKRFLEVAWKQVHKKSKATGCSFREAAYCLAVSRLKEALDSRGYS